MKDPARFAHSVTETSCQVANRLSFTSRLVLLATLSACSAQNVTAQNVTAQNETAPNQSTQAVLQWSFPPTAWTDHATLRPDQPDSLEAALAGTNPAITPGPQPPGYPDFSPQNTALAFNGTSWLAFDDPGSDSPFDFQQDDSITIESWVRLDQITEGQQVYVIGKGRTHRPGFPADNQNWALRLRGSQGQGVISFLFRSQSPPATVTPTEPQTDTTNPDTNKTDADAPKTTAEYHRWNSHEGVPLDNRWHHVAVRFQFGSADSIAAFLDGHPVTGSWDMGSNHNAPPVVDDGQVWIGSSMGGNPGNSLRGALDNLQVHRGLVSDELLKTRYQCTLPSLNLETLPDSMLGDNIVVEVVESVGSGTDWNLRPGRITTRFNTDRFALTKLPGKYNTRGIQTERSNAFLVRLRGWVELPPSGQLLLRSKNSARLLIDDKTVVSTDFMSRAASGHEPVPDLAPPRIPGMHPVPPGHQEQTVTLSDLPTGRQLLTLETLVGGPGLRLELGDLCLAVQDDDASTPFQLLAISDTQPLLLTSEDWLMFEAEQAERIQSENQSIRIRVSAEETAYWDQRHEQARTWVANQHVPQPPTIDSNRSTTEPNPIDAWISDALQQRNLAPQPLIDDFTFLRRVYLDTVGVPPSREEILAFITASDEVDSQTRRQQVIDQLLDDPRWADHWVSYWQDVLAENPGILKPTLNNTGPFRYWIHEAFLDNRPLDRFATELIRMDGGRYTGAPGGFSMATENDVPMAAKGIVLGQAFLGVNLSCARCHDSPNRDRAQKDLFELAALLNQAPIQLPATSSVPIDPHGRIPAVTVSLKPGTSVAGEWPFADEDWGEFSVANSVATPYAATDREQVALQITSPENQRFSQMMANRVWARWMGQGLMEPVDDWEVGSTRHEELLQWLGLELTRNNYDLKHIARLILSSQTYQRQTTTDQEQQRWFAGPTPRRLSAEQLVDSLHAISGKSLGCEILSLDPEGRRPASTFLNLGVPRRAWEMVGLSNERDRPALALPVAQGVVDFMTAFGWRESRPNSASYRDTSPQVLQPLALANGNMAHRLTQLSESSWFTTWSLEADTPDQWLQGLTLQILGRPPTPEELADLTEVIAEGFDQRRIADAKPLPFESQFRNAVSWSNHLHPDATTIKLRLEALARRGDQPTCHLTDDWRIRAEDVVWVLMNSPELVYVP